MKTENKKTQTSEENNWNQNNLHLINRNSNKRNMWLLSLTMLLCTWLIITTNYIFSVQTTNDIHKIINNIEYNKVWWEENYKLLRELQKDQMLKYVDEVKKNDPEYIDWLKRKYQNPEELQKNMILSEDELDKFKSDTLIYWNTWAKLSIVEFSDFECSFCKDFHNSWVITRILERNKESVNYIYKNVPNSKLENSLEIAKAGKCILAKTDWEKYFNYINEIFKETSTTEIKKESIKKIIDTMVEKNWIKKEDFNNCIASQDITDSVNKEKWQARYLWLKTTPSIVIINSKNWKYYIYEWIIEESVLNAKIEELLK